MYTSRLCYEEYPKVKLLEKSEVKETELARRAIVGIQGLTFK